MVMVLLKTRENQLDLPPFLQSVTGRSAQNVDFMSGTKYFGMKLECFDDLIIYV